MVQKDRGFQIFANALMIFLVICVLAPFFLMLMSSLTDEQTLIANGYSFFPKKFSTYAYRYLLVQSGSVARGYFISVTITDATAKISKTNIIFLSLDFIHIPTQ